ncbi:MAG: hypothetical protein HFJ12_04420, partial [Bacilli bacterium]|nr:hypothetical protein [Bacilli bacterium]
AAVVFYDESFKEINSQGTSCGSITTKRFLIPSGTKYISFSSGYFQLHEINVSVLPNINIKKVYPTLTEYGVEKGYSQVFITYPKTAVRKLYSIDNGETWQNYTEGLKISSNIVLKAKSVDQYGNDSVISEYTSMLPEDAIGVEAYDNNEGTSFYAQAVNESRAYTNKSIKLLVSEEMRGKSIRLIAQIYNAHISFYDENNQQLDSKGYDSNQSVNEVLIIPENTTYVSFDQFSDSNSYVKIFEIIPINEESSSYSLRKKKSNILSEVSAPIIQVEKEGDWTISKTVTIIYSNDTYINEYSTDSVNYLPYEGPIRITEPCTIYARSKKDNITLSQSSYNIIKVDNKEPKISLDYLPYAIRVGSLYSLPSYQSFDDNISGGETICYANDVVVNSTKDLGVGTYQIKCVATTGSGIQAIVQHKLQVIDILEDTNHTHPEIEEVPNSNTPIGEDEEKDEGLVANIETTVPRRSPIAANNTEETQE